MRIGTVVPFLSTNVVYPALQGHADLFFAFLPTANGQPPYWIIAAPNAPSRCTTLLQAAGIAIMPGSTAVGSTAASCGAYNVACSSTIAVGNRSQCDTVLLQQLGARQFIQVRQGMARCSTLFVGTAAAITSDPGIHRALCAAHCSSLLVSCQDILLPGYACGCFGGCCGVMDDKVFIVGRLARHPQGEEIRTFLQQNGKEAVELYDGPLWDVGSIFFL